MANGSEMLPQAKTLAARAVEADPKLSRAHLALGVAQLLHARNLADAERNFCVASDLDPSDALCHRWYAKLSFSKGRHEEAVSKARRALRGSGNRRLLTNKLQKLYKSLPANGQQQILC